MRKTEAPVTPATWFANTGMGGVLRAVVTLACGMACGLDAARAEAPSPVENGLAAKKGDVQIWNFEPDPKLPDVLIIGDSISGGYTPHVQKAFKEEANIFHAEKSRVTPLSSLDTGNGLNHLKELLGDRNWRVIHFNFGLHDMKYLDEKGEYVSPGKGKQVVLPDQYEKNLGAIVTQLKRTGAVLIWGTTTPVPDGANARVEGDEIVYNAAAAKVMADQGVLVDDLCGAVKARLADLQRPRNVHFTDKGYKVLAESVSASIRRALEVEP